jgi:hypothetical protein
MHTDGLPVVENEWKGAIAGPEALLASFYDDFLTAQSKARFPSPSWWPVPLTSPLCTDIHQSVPFCHWSLSRA